MALALTTDSASGQATREGRTPERGRFRQALASGWVPVVVGLAITLAWLDFYGVSPLTTGKFLAYLVVCVTVPGTLLWRLVHRGPGLLATDLAAGASLGYVIEVLTYILGRWVGVPLLPLVPLLGVIVVFAAVPRLRRYWRGAPAEQRPPALWLWSLLVLWLVVLFWSVKYVRYHGMTWPSYGAPDTDMPFHLALLGEAKHHMPLVTPWVSGEPVLYHWFVYAQMASTSWITGIEPFVLLTRLSMLPFLAGFIVLIAALTRRLTGNWWTGPVAVMLTFFVLAPQPYGWSLWPSFATFGFSPYEDGSLFRLVLWTSPTQTFGTLLFTPLVWVLVDLFREKVRDRRPWTLFALLCVGVMGAKATYLPILLAGLLFVVAVQLVFRRTLNKPALLAAAITFACLLFASLVLFGGGGAAQGLGVKPLGSIRTSAAPVTVGITVDPKLWRVLLLTALALFCWACVWAGVVGLRRRLLESPMLLLLGMGLAGIGAVLVFYQPGGSQGFFLQSARPYLGIAAACGLSALVKTMTWRRGLALLGAAAVGVVAVRIVRAVDGPALPMVSAPRLAKHVAFELTWPYAVLAALIAIAVVVMWRFRRRVGGLSMAVVIAFAAGLGLFGSYARLSSLAHQGHRDGWREALIDRPFVSKGTVEAGRWLRDHSNPNDIVATNAHCHPQADPAAEAIHGCDNVHFSVAAYSERRVLVEGWGFSPTAHLQAEKLNVSYNYVPYWKPDVLADNDAAFDTPSWATVNRLRNTYHVRWLFVDETQGKPSPDIGRYATLGFRSGPSAVYEVDR